MKRSSTQALLRRAYYAQIGENENAIADSTEAIRLEPRVALHYFARVPTIFRTVNTRTKKQRVPCSNELSGDLRTVYATAQKRLQKRVRERRGAIQEPASLVRSITVSPYW